MFAYKDRYIEKFDKTHRDYYLTQGDSFTLTATPVNVDVALISKVTFKFGVLVGKKLSEIYTQEYMLASNNKFYLDVTSETTTQWSVTDPDKEPYVYEIEITYVSGKVETVEQAQFTILPQIVE